jgi:hypothetical protein
MSTIFGTGEIRSSSISKKVPSKMNSFFGSKARSLFSVAQMDVRLDLV